MQLYIWLSSFIIIAFNYNACVCLSFFCVFPAPWLIFIQCFWGTLMKSEPQTKIVCLCFPAPCFISNSAFEEHWLNPNLKPRLGAYCVFQHPEWNLLLVAVDFSSDTWCLTWKSGRGGARVKFLSSFRVWEICPSGSFSWNHHTHK